MRETKRDQFTVFKVLIIIIYSYIRSKAYTEKCVAIDDLAVTKSGQFGGAVGQLEQSFDIREFDELLGIVTILRKTYKFAHSNSK